LCLHAGGRRVGGRCVISGAHCILTEIPATTFAVHWQFGIANCSLALSDHSFRILCVIGTRRMALKVTNRPADKAALLRQGNT
jgi:hypothetical protein